MKLKKWLSLLLGLLMFAVPMASCKSGNNPGQSTAETTEKPDVTTEPAETADPDTVPDLPDTLDFGGKVIRFLTRRSDTRWLEWGSNDVLNDSASELDQKVYYRNEEIQRKLNVSFDITHASVGDGADFNALITQASLLDDSYDIISNKAYESVQSSLLDCYINFYELENVNLSKKYWNQTFVEAATVNDNLYTAVGDLNLSVYMCEFCMFFNIDKCRAQGWETEDIFDTVLGGDWTWEELAKYVTEANVNPDAETPMYAIYSHWYSQAYDGLIRAFDMQLVTTDPDNGKHSLVAGNGWTKMQNAASMIHNLYFNAEHTGKLDTTGSATGEYNLFDAGQTLFSVECVNDAQKRKQAELTDDYGLLPLPKYDKEQATYQTGVQDSHNTISVMKGNRNFAAIGAVLELMNAYSYDGVRPYYVDTLVKHQYLDDPKSAEILNLVLDGAGWDFAAVYASYLLDDQGGKAPHDRLWRAGVHNGVDNLQSRYASYKDYWNGKLQEFDSDPHFAKKAD